MTSRRTALKLGAAVAGSFMINRGALAADSIRLIVPWPQGSVASSTAKLIQGPFAKAMSMAVVIDYVLGDSGKVGTREAIRSKPDSRTLFINLPDAMANWEHQGDKLLADLRPVAKVTRGMSDSFVVRADSALKDWQGMAAASKVSALTMAYYGGGGILLLAMVKKRAGMSFTMQPTDGPPFSAATLLSGKADLAYLPTNWILTHNEKAAAKDKLRLLATFGAERHPGLPDVPTFAEIVGDRKAATTFSFAIWSAANADAAFTDKATAALLSIAENEAMHAEARKLRIPLQIEGPQVVLETLARDRRVIQDVLG
jgi:tripartite-type tricarboxylate transporter receptor subunit TctC